MIQRNINKGEGRFGPRIDEGPANLFGAKDDNSVQPYMGKMTRDERIKRYIVMNKDQLVVDVLQNAEAGYYDTD